MTDVVAAGIPVRAIPPPGPPRPKAPGVLGRLNVAFGLLLIAYAGYEVLYLLGMPIFSDVIRAQVNTGSQNGLTADDTLTVIGLGPAPGYMAWKWANAILGGLLNLAMVVAGVGLIMYRPWGRKLALAVAALKLVRLLASEIVYMSVVPPAVARQWAEMLPKLAPPGQPSGGPEMGVVQGVMSTLGSLTVLILGSIYPIICLWLLWRRDCLGEYQPTRTITDVR